MKNLCTDILLGIDFQRQHTSVKYHFGGEMPELNIHGMKQCEEKSCNLVQADVKAQTLFQGMYRDVKPIAAKSRQFSTDDRKFIDDQVTNLLKEGVIEESKSPWRAQIVISKDESGKHKKRMCIDFS